MNFDFIVIGFGFGGYVVVIWVVQLGMKVGVVECENFGGVCLNWGCILIKVLFKSVQVFEYIQYVEDYGIQVKDVKVDFGSMINCSCDVVNGMSKGINFLFCKNKIMIIEGEGCFLWGKKVEVIDKDGKKMIYEVLYIIVVIGVCVC